MYVLYNNFFYPQLVFAFVSQKDHCVFLKSFSPFVFFFLRTILISFTCFFSKLSFVFNNSYLPFLYIEKKIIKNIRFLFEICKLHKYFVSSYFLIHILYLIFFIRIFFVRTFFSRIFFIRIRNQKISESGKYSSVSSVIYSRIFFSSKTHLHPSQNIWE